MKTCKICKKSKDLDQYHKCKTGAQGLQAYCKPCFLSYLKIYNKENPVSLRKIRSKSYKKRYSKNKESILKKNKDWRFSNTEKYITSRNNWKNTGGQKPINSIQAKRRTAKLQRIPAWADLEAIKQIYLNCPKSHEVDHIIPLQGINISGLHVAENLQYLTKLENARKSNKWSNQ